MNRLFKKSLKIILVFVVLLVAVLGVLFFVYNEKLPVGTNPEKADLLAQKMLTAINTDLYKNTRYLEWSFAGGKHKYIWDKENGKVKVIWDDYLVHLNLNNSFKSEVFKNGNHVIGNSKAKLILQAQDYFNNDSFWLVAPFKVFDKGTTRSIVKLEDGTDGILVTYSSGGTTPGDSYLWKLQANGFPESYKMWTKIIPLGGLEATWDDWKVMENGVFLPASHKLGPITLSMGEVRAYN